MAVLATSDAEAVLRATAALDEGGLVVLPTDTTYALAADALNEEAVERAFRAVGRPADAPMPVAVGSLEEAHHVAFLTPLARDLAARHWPGPLALVLRARPWLPDALTAGGASVAVRVPAQAFARDLARHFGPVALTPARRAGGEGARDVAQARAALGAEAALYLDAGALPGGRVTVVDAQGAEAKVLRAGALAAAEVAADGAGRA